MTQKPHPSLGYTMAEAITALAPAEFAGNVALYLKRKGEGKPHIMYYSHEDVLWAALIDRAKIGELTFMGFKHGEFEMSSISVNFLLAFGSRNPSSIITLNSIGKDPARYDGVRVFIAADLAPLPATKVPAKVISKTGPKSHKTDAVTRAMLENLQTGKITEDQLRREKHETLLSTYQKDSGATSFTPYIAARKKALSLFAEGRNTDK